MRFGVLLRQTPDERANVEHDENDEARPKRFPRNEFAHHFFRVLHTHERLEVAMNDERHGGDGPDEPQGNGENVAGNEAGDENRITEFGVWVRVFRTAKNSVVQIYGHLVTSLRVASDNAERAAIVDSSDRHYVRG